MNAIEIHKLNKIYKATKKAPAKIALKDVDLTIPRGSIFGLLGPNGAGKSTIINIMAGLVVKTSGSVRIWDYDIDSHLRQAKCCIGVVPQEINYDPFFTPLKLLELQAGLYGVPVSERRSMEILKTVGLADKANAYTRSLSGGMKRRLLMAKAMVHSPPILVLDEPTAGVDIELRKQLWANVKALNAKGVTILLTTHYLEEAQELCDRIAIINHGQVVASEGKGDLLGRINSKEIRFYLENDLHTLPLSLQGYMAILKNGRELHIQYNPKEQNVSQILHALEIERIGVADITTVESDLEDVFLQLTAA